MAFLWAWWLNLMALTPPTLKKRDNSTNTIRFFLVFIGILFFVYCSIFFYMIKAINTKIQITKEESYYQSLTLGSDVPRSTAPAVECPIDIRH